jgi:phage anti-repressor protein
MIYIIGCSKNKLKKMDYAKNLYTGALFKTAYKYALKRTSEDKIFILSAKYGLIKHRELIAPYNEKIGKNESITIDSVREQVKRFGILDKDVTVLAGSAYTSFLEKIFSKPLYLPLKKLSLGYSLQYLKRGLE